mgnify:CR=1 FL=1
MSEFEKSALNKVVRGPNRAVYSKADVYKIVDSHFLCHLAYVYEGTPIVIPTGYGRKGDVLYVHGSSKNRMLNYLLENESVSATITHMDGIVLAKSVFHHSFNYRSAVLFGKPRLVSNEAEKMDALKIITDNIIEGRWEEARYPNAKEMKATMVMAIDINDASAKIRAEGANDDIVDADLEVWTGVLPLTVTVGQPEPNHDCNPSVEIPNSVVDFNF